MLLTDLYIRQDFSATLTDGDGIPAELFQILKDDAVKVLQLNMPANLENLALTKGLGRSVFILISKKDNAKECSNCHIIALSHMLTRQCSTSSKLAFNSI